MKPTGQFDQQRLIQIRRSVRALARSMPTDQPILRKLPGSGWSWPGALDRVDRPNILADPLADPPIPIGLPAAQANLCQFVLSQACQESDILGFSWRVSELAPCSYEALQAEYRLCQITKLPLRVASSQGQSTIYADAKAQHASRFWQDTWHVRFNLGFDAHARVELGVRQLDTLRGVGFASDSLEHRLLWAESIGQAICSAQLGYSPADQRKFILRVLASGLEAAIQAERDVGAAVDDSPRWPPAAA